MGKEKKEKKVKQSAGSDNEEETRVLDVSPIAHPLAEKKLNKKLLKTVKKGAHLDFRIMIHDGLDLHRSFALHVCLWFFSFILTNLFVFLSCSLQGQEGQTWCEGRC